MIEVSLSLIERDVIKISPKIGLHWDMRRTEHTVKNQQFKSHVVDLIEVTSEIEVLFI